MKKLLLASTALCFATVAATAADIAAVPVKAPPPVVSSSWAGFYLGVHGGYGWRDSDFSDLITIDPVQTIGGVKSRGGVFGGQAGYNWQFGRVVTGLEFDLSGANISGSVSQSLLALPGQSETLSLADNIKYLGTARARLGWLPTDTVLLYGTAGLGWERYERTSTESIIDATVVPTATALLTATQPFDRFGWVAGAGVEAKLFGPHWIGRLEYLHYDFGRAESFASLTLSGTGATDGTFSGVGGRQTIDVLRAGLSYKFGDCTVAASPVSYAKAPIAPVNSSWAGFYLGAHGGYGWGQDNFSNGVLVSTPSPIPLIDGPRSQGGIGGGQAGFNWQYDRVVTGIEADFSVSSIRGASNLAFPDGVGDIDIESRSDSVKYLGTLRGRVGWLPVSNVLVYGTAGLAWERLEQTTTDITPIETQVITQPSDRFGWVAGVGVESMVSGTNWIGRLEYLHYDFGTVASVVTDTTVPLFEHGGKQTSDVLRAGLSYKFGPSAASSSVPYTKAPPLSMASWAGFYLGVHGGYGWNDDDFTVVVVPSPLATIGSIKSQGAVGGGQAGYNWQNGSVVGGFELDVSATSSNGTSQTGLITVPGATESASFSDNVNYLGTARARLGWTPSQNVLLYGTGGLAWERVERTQISTITSGAVIDMQTERDAHDFFGWAAGIGAETMLFGPNWIGRLEYLHYDFGKVQPVQTVISNTPLLPSGSDRAGRQTIDVIRAGISYKFSADGPIVARY